MKPDVELIYVGDPMCSWCWGFAPVLEQLDQRFELPLRVVVGGLRPGPAAEVLDEGLKQVLLHHWQQVEEASGQPFDHAGLDRVGWRYDTMVPDTAVVTMRHIDDAKTLPFFATLQRAFYEDVVDITDPAVYPTLLGAFDVDVQKFSELMGSDEMRDATIEDFRLAQRLGVSGFPTLLLRDGEQGLRRDSRLRSVRTDRRGFERLPCGAPSASRVVPSLRCRWRALLTLASVL